LSQPVYVTKQILVPQSTNIVGSVSSGTAIGTVNSSNMPLDTQRRIVFLSTAADTSSLKLTIVGTQQGGGRISEIVQGSTAGASTTATTRQDFLTVTSITASSLANVAILVGTSSVAGSPWVMANWWVTPPALSATAVLNSSGATATWEFTLDDPTETYYPNPNITAPSVFASTGIAAATGSSGATLGSTATTTMGAISFAVAAWRMTLTSSSSTYALNATVLQAGAV
jgi:hypothetical protein